MKLYVNGIKYIINPEFGGYALEPFLCTMEDLFVTVYNEESYEELPLEQSPCYKCLLGDPKQYEEYCELVKRKYNKEDKHNKEDFMKLTKSILEDGYDTERPIIIKYENQKYIIVDGQHRAAALLFKGYDDDLLVLKVQ